MPPKKGGKKTKRGKKTTTDDLVRYTPFAEEGQMYAVVTKMLGNRRLTAKCKDGKERLVHIPGKFKGKRNWISVGMVVLLNIRDYQDDKSDVIYIYNEKDCKLLRRKGQLDGLVEEDEEVEDCGFIFGGSESEHEAEEPAEESDIDLDEL